jgi:multisubunit Na+/H+ antiporter MnhB subunit
MNGTWTGTRVLALVLLVLAAVLLLLAVIYFTVPARSLPVFLGRIASVARRRRRRGLAALVLGVVLLVVSLVTFARSRTAER